ncbi:MAG: hypothetical protein A2201_13680 [Alicyclobacillus sp. RIFOXYA1_FULL_53_8]|nr:MAG: hypothetical protein A2201_13680 [Alicyclobacillus sp. RIFOXYA1_FULL_53_8]
MFNRVRVRLTLLTVGIFLSLYIISSVAVYTIVRQVVLRGVDAQLVLVLNQLRTNRSGTVMPNLAQGIHVVINNPPEVRSNVPSALQGHLGTLIANHPTRRRWSTMWTTSAGTQFRIIYWPLPETPRNARIAPRYILVLENVTREFGVLQRLGRVFLFVAAGGVIVATLGGFFLAERALRPIRRAWQRQLEFVADASHELRTPLAVIQSNLEIVLDHSEQSVIDNLEWINNAHGESRRLSKLVSDLLTLARSDTVATPIVKQRVSLDGLLRHVVDLFEPIASARGLTLGYAGVGDLAVEGDGGRLHQLFVILVDNACKYTPTQGSIQLTVDSGRNTATVHVANSGEGIPEDELERVFERFYRADKARTHGTEDDADGGTGLGLAIAKWIVEAHEGKISITSRPGEGTAVHVQLPLDSTSA